MTLKEAVRLGESETGGKVLYVSDCKDRWILEFDFEEGAQSSIVYCCFKDSGKFTYFFPPDEPDVLENAKPVPLPE